jgi:hypothetical protein
MVLCRGGQFPGSFPDLGSTEYNAIRVSRLGEGSYFECNESLAAVGIDRIIPPYAPLESALTVGLMSSQHHKPYSFPARPAFIERAVSATAKRIVSLGPLARLSQFLTRNSRK